MIALGVCVAIFGFRTFDMYFGIVFLVAAVGFLAAAIVGVSKYRILHFGLLFAFTALTTFGVIILMNQFSLYYMVIVLVYLLIALGGALVIYGVYAIGKINGFYGIGQIVLGAVAITIGILYLLVPEFGVAFWIIVGVLIAVYGVLLLVNALIDKKHK
jgi:hypothetical protein